MGKKNNIKTKNGARYVKEVSKRIADNKPFSESEINSYIDSGVSILLKGSKKNYNSLNNIILGMTLKSVELLISLRKKLFKY